ncbi:MAG TPA: hypothetical protein PLX20_12525 [Rhodocyclaceae bacterium]|nr:hypothetical protein [Rhodocyclaceae bacterium]HMV53485.1 hypothetical protein [Rhodocyclaceae bacterium]HMZ84658.1 hypothetical protein [Rhodocyclaceae bacterium]HNC62332.1 hypothetical protein [Rhodocyclaceae bacterium]HNH13958.1 hypothetical protein [Rhodocyclaceae bacterium]
MAKKESWKKFPHADKAYQYAGAALKKNWVRLHQGDAEAFPDEAGLKALVKANPGLAESADDLKASAEALQEAWRLYHAGEFQKAHDAGLEVGMLGYTVANKAACIYGNYLETADTKKLALFEEVTQRCEELQGAAPKWANAWYFHAYALGRYSQGISVVKALAQGLGGKIKDSLSKTIKLESGHSDAHIAFGTYHAEIIDKVGALLGGATYGASKDEGVKHFKQALKLNPESAIARIEYANGLVMMFGKGRLDEAGALYEEAAQCEPLDAMERLDVELAKSELED